jgi:hypothetical protein
MEPTSPVETPAATRPGPSETLRLPPADVAPPRLPEPAPAPPRLPPPEAVPSPSAPPATEPESDDAFAMPDLPAAGVLWAGMVSAPPAPVAEPEPQPLAEPAPPARKAEPAPPARKAEPAPPARKAEPPPPRRAEPAPPRRAEPPPSRAAPSRAAPPRAEPPPSRAEPEVDPAQVRNALASVRTRVQGLRHRHGRLPEALSRLRRRFVLASFSDIEKHPAEAERNLRVAAEWVSIADKHADREDWALARTAVAEARRALDSATVSIDAVGDRLTALERIADDPKAPLERARFAVRDAQRLYRMLGTGTQPEHAERLDSLGRRVDAVAETLAGLRPNYWQAGQELEQIRTEVAEVVARMRGTAR